MQDISNMTGQELPPTTKLLWSTLLALAVATALLLTTVLPAEYGLDPTGLGKKMGLTALHQSDGKADNHHQDAHTEHKTDDHSHEQGAAHSHEHTGSNDAEHTHVSQAPAVEALQKRTEKWRSDNIQLSLPPKQGIEVKTLLDQGERLLFQWTVSGGTVRFDMHGNKADAADDDYTSFRLGKGETQSAGTFAAPFSGLHGWYWENESDQAITVTLELEGYYKDIVRY